MIQYRLEGTTAWAAATELTRYVGSPGQPSLGACGAEKADSLQCFSRG